MFRKICDCGVSIGVRRGRAPIETGTGERHDCPAWQNGKPVAARAHRVERSSFGSNEWNSPASHGSVSFAPRSNSLIPFVIAMVVLMLAAPGLIGWFLQQFIQMFTVQH